MRKGVLVVGLFFAVMFSGFASAVPCALGDSDTIMKLYQTNNSHGGLWNSSVYNETICYSDIFGSPYNGLNSGDDAVHTCTENNRILSLSDVTNAHASEHYDVVTYNQNVCYGDLACEYENDTTGNDCSSWNNGEIVARLFSANNSHISDASDTAYPIKICCVAGAPAGGREWRDTGGREIFNREVGDTVVIFDGDYEPAVAGGSPIIFEVIEASWIHEDVRTVALRNEIIGYYDYTIGAAIANWTITQADMNRVSERDYKKFQFKTNSSPSSGNYGIPDLEISRIRNDDSLTVSIINPSCGDYFNQGTNESITISANDSDDFINGSLFVMDGVNDDRADFTFGNGLSTFNHVFNDPGNVRVVVDAVNSRGVRIRNSSSIMVIDTSADGDYLAACIDEPEDLARITSSIVKFNAGSTTGRSYSASTNSSTEILKSAMTFNWEFTNNKTGTVRTNPISDGSNPESYDFVITFAESGQNRAVLEVILV